MGKIIIHRKQEAVYKAMKFHIILNGNKIGTINIGESFSTELQKGNYELVIKNGLIIKSNKIKFKLEEYETREFLAESFKNGFIKNFIKLSEVEANDIP